MMRKTRGSSYKEPAARKASGLAHLMTALHQSAAAVVTSNSQLNGPDQVGIVITTLLIREAKECDFHTCQFGDRREGAKI